MHTHIGIKHCERPRILRTEYRPLAALYVCIVSAFVIVMTSVFPLSQAETSTYSQTVPGTKTGVSTLATIQTASDASLIMPLSEDEARLANDQLPFSREPIEQANPLRLDRYAFTPEEIDRATRCLADAIYYEAGFEPEQGKRAVAQVVLNRVRHPAYPSSVCDVVYEGAERSTGCQFTFTCDGSKARAPVPSAWQSARRVAAQALSGQIEPSVGMATHYHANYVIPYWAKNLTKITMVGQHIFYRWAGSWGKRTAFTLRPMPDDETIPELDILTPATEQANLPDLMQDPLPAPEPLDRYVQRIEDISSAQPASLPTNSRLESDTDRSVLKADERVGTLKIDQKD